MEAGPAGDARDTFSALFRRHYQEVFSYARRRTGPDVAQEIVAETFLVAWRRFDDLPDSALPWLYRIAAFEIANMTRKNERHSKLVRRLHLEPPVADAVSTELDDRLGRVAAAFEELSDGDREVLRLAAWEGLTASEAAEVLGCTSTAFRVRLHRARARLERMAEADPRDMAEGQDEHAPRSGDGDRQPGGRHAREEKENAS